VNNSAVGLIAILKGYQYLFHPKTRTIAWAPVAITLFLYFGAFSYLFSQLDWIEASVRGAIPDWEIIPQGLIDFLFGLVYVFIFLSTMMVVNYTFVAIAGVIASPFSSFLSEEVLKDLGDLEESHISWANLVGMIPQILMRELSKMWRMFLALLLVLLLTFIPLVNVLSPLYWFLFGCWMLSLQYIDYPADAQQIPIKDTMKAMGKTPWARYTFGAGLSVLVHIPILNCLLVPAATAGATWLWSKHIKPTAQIGRASTAVSAAPNTSEISPKAE
jgi:CysZ protein